MKDDERSRRPKEAVIDENIKKVHKLVLNDQKMTLLKIAEALNISKGRVDFILKEHLNMRKLCVKWEPRFLIKNNNKGMILSTV